MGYLITAVAVYVLIAVVVLIVGSVKYYDERDYTYRKEAKRRSASLVALWWVWPVLLYLFMKEAYKDAGL